MKDKLNLWLVNLIDKAASVEIEVAPRSPFYPAYTKVYIRFFNKWRWLVEETTTPMTDDGYVDLVKLVYTFPMVRDIRVEYPKGWDNLVSIIEGEK